MLGDHVSHKSVYVCVCLYLSVYVCICLYMSAFFSRDKKIVSECWGTMCPIGLYMFVYVCICLYMSVYISIYVFFFQGTKKWFLNGGGPCVP